MELTAVLLGIIIGTLYASAAGAALAACWQARREWEGKKAARLASDKRTLLELAAVEEDAPPQVPGEPAPAKPALVTAEYDGTRGGLASALALCDIPFKARWVASALQSEFDSMGLAAFASLEVCAGGVVLLRVVHAKKTGRVYRFRALQEPFSE